MLDRRAGSIPTRSPTNVLVRQIGAGLKACQPGVLLAALVASGILAIYASQTALGHWQTDEFRYFYDHKILGWSAYFARFQVSPRPFSELLIYIYGAAVLAFDQDFVPQALLTLWGTSLLSIVLAAWGTLHRSPSRLAATISLGIAPMVFVMQTNPITELFYWPAATFAYLPSIAAISSLMFLLGDTLTSKRRLWCCAALLVAATSHEIGAAFAIGFAMINGVFAVGDRRSAQSNAGATGIAGALWWIMPATAGFVVMVGLVLFRSVFVDLGSDGKPYTGRILASAGIACWQMLVDVVSTGSSSHTVGGALLAILQKASFVCGFALTWLRYGRIQPGRWHLAFGFGLGVAVFFSIFAAYYHYGDLCCQRQATARQWLIDLLLTLVAVAVFGRWSIVRILPRLSLSRWLEHQHNIGYGIRRHWGPLLLMASLLPVLLQFPAIRSDARELAMARQGRARTWVSGRALANGQMQFYMPPDNANMLIHGTSVPIGTFDLTEPLPNTFDPEGASLVVAVGRYFGATILTTCQPWQTDQSFLIDGRFIPACPPHDGPPDIILNTVLP